MKHVMLLYIRTSLAELQYICSEESQRAKRNETYKIIVCFCKENIMLRKILAICVLLSTLARGAVISFKRVNTFEAIWKDSGSGAFKDVSIWRPVEKGYYALGDVASSSHSQPRSGLVVKDMGYGFLMIPKSFERVWDDKGSGAYADVTIWKMIPYDGFKCLGNIAIKSHETSPQQKGNYRCVHTSVLTSGMYNHIWSDHGSGARKDVSLWEVVKDTTNVNGINGNTFIAQASYDKPSMTPSLLDSKYAKQD